MLQEMYDKWAELPLPLRVATGAAFLGGTAATGVAGGALLYYLLDPKAARKRARETALGLVDRSDKALAGMEKRLQADQPGGWTPYATLSTAGPGVGIGPEAYPVFAGIDTTGVDAGYIMRPEQAEWLARPFVGRRRAEDFARSLPARPFIAARLGPSLIPVEAGLAVGKQDIENVKRSLSKLHQSLSKSAQDWSVPVTLFSVLSTAKKKNKEPAPTREELYRIRHLKPNLLRWPEGFGRDIGQLHDPISDEQVQFARMQRVKDRAEAGGGELLVEPSTSKEVEEKYAAREGAIAGANAGTLLQPRLTTREKLVAADPTVRPEL